MPVSIRALHYAKAINPQVSVSKPAGDVNCVQKCFSKLGQRNASHKILFVVRAQGKNGSFPPQWLRVRYGVCGGKFSPLSMRADETSWGPLIDRSRWEAGALHLSYDMFYIPSGRFATIQKPRLLIHCWKSTIPGGSTGGALPLLRSWISILSASVDCIRVVTLRTCHNV